MTKIILVRHGHVEGIKPERFRGRQDVALSDLGRLEARAMARYIVPQWHPTMTYTSPLQRCMQTAQEIGGLRRTEPEKLDAFNDLDYGQWQWQTHEEVSARWPEQFDLWRKAPQRMRFPQGESLQDLSARVADGLRLILQRHPNETIVVVGHDSSNRILLLQLLDMPLAAYWRLAQDPCGVSELEVSSSEAKVLRINEMQHLRVKSS